MGCTCDPGATLTFLSEESLLTDMGSRDGAVMRALASHQCDPGFGSQSRVICGLLNLLLVLFLAPREVCPCISGFPLSSKT